MNVNMNTASLARFGLKHRHLVGCVGHPARNPEATPLILAVSAALMALLLLAIPCRAEGRTSCQVSVSALSLPAGSTGLLHWRVSADSATTPLQLSTRYFSEHLKLPGNVIAFYDAPVAAGQTEPPPPEPLLRLKIPAGSKLTYIVLWATPDANPQVRWRWSAKFFDSEEWPAGSMKLLNTTPETLGISAGKKQISLKGGKNIDFRARDWPDAFPMKMYRLDPPPAKLIFSSSMRVAAGRRELCLVGIVDGSITMQSLIKFSSSPAARN